MTETRLNTWRDQTFRALMVGGILVGGVIFPIIGWIVAAFGLLTSQRWGARSKALGILAFPGGLLPAAYWFIHPAVNATCPALTAATGATATTPQYNSCAYSATPVESVGIAVLAVLLLVPIITAVVLWRTWLPPAEFDT